MNKVQSDSKFTRAENLNKQQNNIEHQSSISSLDDTQIQMLTTVTKLTVLAWYVYMHM